MHLDSIRKLLNSRKRNFTSKDIVEIHRHVEGYIDRLIFIDIRVHGVQYKTAKTVMLLYYQPLNKRIDRVVRSYQLGNYLGEDWKSMLTLVEKFSSGTRNLLAHGVIQRLNDQEVVNLSCRIDIEFIRFFEKLLKKVYGKSALDQPKVWGASRGVISDAEEAMKKLNMNRAKGKLDLSEAYALIDELSEELAKKLL